MLPSWAFARQPAMAPMMASIAAKMRVDFVGQWRARFAAELFKVHLPINAHCQFAHQIFAFCFQG
jgi:hypothetical protein